MKHGYRLLKRSDTVRATDEYDWPDGWAAVGKDSITVGKKWNPSWMFPIRRKDKRVKKGTTK